MLIQEARRGYVGGQHALLDELVSVVAGTRHDFFDLALIVKDDRCFGSIEIDRSALFPSRAQQAIQLVQVFERLD